MLSGAVDEILTIFAVSLRMAPVFAFAQPFTLIRIPTFVRVLLAVALAVVLVGSDPKAYVFPVETPAALFTLMSGELLLGIALSLCLQIAFAALYTVGRTLDIQAGFGLALLADPSLKGQMPLIGTLFAYAAGAVFFSMNGPADLLAIWARTMDIYPPGRFTLGINVAAISEFLSAAFVLAFGLGGIVLLTLFVLDLSIAFISKTLPQMNVLLLGFQVKTLAVLLTLPIAFAVSGSLFLRILRLALEKTPEVIRG
jgi:flagellar biosynthesis protein FliR